MRWIRWGSIHSQSIRSVCAPIWTSHILLFFPEIRICLGRIRGTDHFNISSACDDRFRIESRCWFAILPRHLQVEYPINNDFLNESSRLRSSLELEPHYSKHKSESRNDNREVQTSIPAKRSLHHQPKRASSPCVTSPLLSIPPPLLPLWSSGAKAFQFLDRNVDLV
jgi:hypothetical protein